VGSCQQPIAETPQPLASPSRVPLLHTHQYWHREADLKALPDQHSPLHECHQAADVGWAELRDWALAEPGLQAFPTESRSSQGCNSKGVPKTGRCVPATAPVAHPYRSSPHLWFLLRAQPRPPASSSSAYLRLDSFAGADNSAGGTAGEFVAVGNSQGTAAYAVAVVEDGRRSRQRRRSNLQLETTQRRK